MRVRVLWCLIVLSMAASTAMASDGTLNWAYQSTGFQAGESDLGPQTALAMRDGRVWPVIFSEDSASCVHAYALYPVENPIFTPPTYWHQTGTTVLYNWSGSGILSAATSPDGRVGAVMRAPSSYQDSCAVVGSSRTGFGGSMFDIAALDFNSAGGVVKGMSNTVPGIAGKLVDIAVSPLDELGGLDEFGNYYQKLRTGWQKTSNNFPSNHYADLAFDSLARPHFVTIISGVLFAKDFNIESEYLWKATVLGTNSLLGGTIAADSKGGVGVAWVQDNGTSGTLMYAYNSKDPDSGSGWSIWEVTQTVLGDGSLAPVQRVGLAFDANDFPVISFVAGTNSNIWLAYDPPTAAPEPSTLLLLVGGLFALVVARRSQLRRWLDK